MEAGPSGSDAVRRYDHPAGSPPTDSAADALDDALFNDGLSTQFSQAESIAPPNRS
jgi:hypothetical protein